MDVLLRVMAIFIEVLILALVTYALLNGVRLILFDLGLGVKYGKAVAMMLVTVGGIVVVFFIAHLTAFYPPL